MIGLGINATTQNQLDLGFTSSHFDFNIFFCE